MQRTLRIDIETFSSVDLRKCGVHKYVESYDFQVLLFGYAFDDEPVKIIDLAQGETIPLQVVAAITSKDVIKTAFNAAFEIACLSKYFKQPLPVEQWRCTSVHALYLGLPSTLAEVGRVIGLPPDKQKMSVGSALVRFFCLPCKPTKKNYGRLRNLPHHEPEKWRLFKEYCVRDVEAEREIGKRLLKYPVPADEWALWQLDQKMNNQGIEIDVELVEAAIDCDTLYKDMLTKEAIQLTGLDNPNSRNQLLEWLQEEVEDVTDLTKKSIPKILASTDDATVKRVLQLRQELAKTSVSKYHAMSRAVCDDNRIRGLTQFYGANRTGRWAGRLVQVQNLPQNKLKDLDLARNLLKAKDYEGLEMLFGNVPDTLSQLIRTSFIAGKGKRFIVVDFSAIEARVIAWMAWCQWRIDVFNTHGKIYEASAEQMFKLPAGSVDKKSPYRQRGKVAELALGYQGGAGALKTMGALEMGLKEEELDEIKNAWRAANPQICKLWWDMEDLVRDCITKIASGAIPIANGHSKICVICNGNFMFITLPSGRNLSYVRPHITKEDRPYIKANSIVYEGLDQKTKQWGLVATYGGKLIENITQAVARDCLKESMLALDALGYKQRMTVHDEIVIEMPEGEGSLEEVLEVMARDIPWAPNLNLKGDGFETAYYMKEIE